MDKKIASILLIGLILIVSGTFVKAFNRKEFSTVLLLDEDNTIIVEFGGNTSFNGDRVIEVNMDGNIVWEFGNISQPHDVERLPNGNTLITVYDEGRVIEVNPSGYIVWQITELFGPMDAERLPDGNILITEYLNNSVTEFKNDKTVVWKINDLKHPFDAERLSNGNTLITQAVSLPNGSVIEVNASRVIVWEIDGLDAPVDAERLPNGNTLITEHIGKKVIEVDKNGIEVWNISNLYVPKDAERLGNSNTLIADCGANRVIEVNSSGTIKWIKSNLVYPTDAERLGQPPFEPTIEGPDKVVKDVPATYTFNVSHPNHNQIYYNITWGDDTGTYWIGPFISGVPVDISHTWKDRGTYEIKCKAKDGFDNIGPEKTFIVTVPKNKPFDFNLIMINWLFEHFPLLYRLLQVIR